MKNRIWVVVIICTIVAMALAAGGAFAAKAYTPSTSKQWDLGTTKLQYKDIVISGDITSNSVKVIDSGAIAGSALTAASVTGDALALNAVGVREAFVNTVPVTVAASGTSGTATVTSGSAILGFYPNANVHDGNINGVANISIASTTLTLAINGTAGSNAVLYSVVVMEP
jgi:hypothetical protein